MAWQLKTSTVAIISAGLLVVGYFALRPAETRYVVTAGPVTGNFDGGVQGTFRIYRKKPRDQFVSAGIPSNLVGGACLAFNAEDLGDNKMKKIHCTANSNCGVASESMGAYCHVPTNTCWAKPPGSDDALCDKGHVFAEGVDHTIPLTPAKLASLGIKKGAQARVVACINMTGATAYTGCKSKDGTERMEVMGSAAPVN